MFKELKIPNVFTIEASFSGADIGSLSNKHFGTEQLMNIGIKVLETLLVYHRLETKNGP